MAVGSTNIVLGATVTNFLAGFSQARTAVSGLVTDLNSKLATAYSNADRQSGVFRKGIDRLGGSLQDVGSKLSAYVTAPILGVGAAAFKTYADIDSLLKGLENITGSAAGAKARFDELREVAKLPGLGLEEAVKGDVRLQAIGFSAQTAKEALLQFGNAIALTGGGRTELDTVITQLSQMGSKAKVLAEDLKPILNASPAVAKAVRGLYGTVDSESISKNLTKAGKGPADFIRELIGELSKLERVKGGPKNAIENFGDALKISAFNIGEAADKVFNLTAAFTSVGDFIGKVAERFGELPASTQKIILTVTGLAAAIGPLTIGLGSVIKLLPLITTGFSALTGPVGLAVAAVAGAAVLIATNWESIKGVLMDSGIWNSLVALVATATESAQAIWQAFTGLLGAFWTENKDTILGVTRALFSGLSTLFKTGAGLLTGVFKLITGVLTLDWSKFSEGLQNITASIWNGITGIIASAISVSSNLIAGFLSKVGADSLAADIRTFASQTDKALAGIQIRLQQTKRAASEINLPEVTITGKRTVGKDNFASGVQSGTGKTGKLTGEFAELKTFLDIIQSEANRVKEAIASIGTMGGKVSDALYDRLDALNRLVARGQSAVSRTELPDAKEIGPPKSPSSTRLEGQFNYLKDSKINQYVEGIQQAAEIIKNAYAQLREEVKGAAVSTALDLSTGLGEIIGGAITGQTNGFAALIKLAFDFLSQYLQRVAQAQIVAGAALVTAGILSVDPVLAAQGRQKLLAGAGIRIAAGAVSAIGSGVANSLGGNVKKFKEGTVAYGPTYGLFGEYAGANTNPEIVTPEKKMRQVVNDALANQGFSGQRIEVYGRISGSDILLAGNRAKANNRSNH